MGYSQNFWLGEFWLGGCLAGRILAQRLFIPEVHQSLPEPGQPSPQVQDRQSGGTAILRLCRQSTHTDTLANNTSISSASSAPWTWTRWWLTGERTKPAQYPLHSLQPGLGALRGNLSPNLATEDARHWSKRTLGCGNAVEIGNKVGI